MEKSFPDYYDYYESVCKSNSHLSGQNMQVNFVFMPKLLLYKLISIFPKWDNYIILKINFYHKISIF